MRNKKVCETIGPVDSELSQMHEAEVHVFQGSVLCVGNQAMNMPEIKLNVMWKEHLAHCMESARKIDGEQIQFIFHLFLGSKTNEMEWIRQGKGEYGQNFYIRKTNYPRRVVFMGMMNEIAINSKEATGGKAQFLQDAERNAAYHSTGNQFDRFRGFLELISRFEFEFCHQKNYFFEGFEFLVCSCECAVACLCPRNSNSNVVASVMVHDDLFVKNKMEEM